MNTPELHQTDLAAWARQNAESMRSGRLMEVDWENVANEIERLARHERAVLQRRLVRLIEHLLKCQYRPGRDRSIWRSTIVRQRFGVLQLLKMSPSLRSELDGQVAKAYPKAVLAAKGTKLTPRDFPQTCPYTIEQLLDRNFVPE